MNTRRYRPVIRLMVLGSCCSATACGRAPSFDILGSYFPAWLFCLGISILLTVLVRGLLLRRQISVAAPILAYPSLAVAFTCALWLTFFQ